MKKQVVKKQAVKKSKAPLKYEVVFDWDESDKIYIARVPELPGCVSHGDTLPEAARMIQEAMELYIETLVDDGKEVPVPLSEKKFSGKVALRLDPLEHRDAVLRARRMGVSLNEFLQSAVRHELHTR